MNGPRNLPGRIAAQACVAFAGPRKGMSTDQLRGIGRILNRWDDGWTVEFHHQGDLTGLDAAEVADRHDWWVVSHPAVGERAWPHKVGVNDEVEAALPVDARDDHLLSVCGRVIVAVGGPLFWERVPAWRFAARAHSLGRELLLVGPDGELADEPQWPATTAGRSR